MTEAEKNAEIGRMAGDRARRVEAHSDLHGQQGRTVSAGALAGVSCTFFTVSAAVP